MVKRVRSPSERTENLGDTERKVQRSFEIISETRIKQVEILSTMNLPQEVPLNITLEKRFHRKSVNSNALLSTTAEPSAHDYFCFVEIVKYKEYCQRRSCIIGHDSVTIGKVTRVDKTFAIVVCTCYSARLNKAFSRAR